MSTIPHPRVAIVRALEGIDRWSAGSRSDLEDIPAGQILFIRAQLAEWLREIDGGNIRPKSERTAGLGKMIVDSWPLESPLGSLIIEAERAYLQA